MLFKKKMSACCWAINEISKLIVTINEAITKVNVLRENINY